MFPKRFRASTATLALVVAVGGLHGAQAQSLTAVYDAAHAYDAVYLAARSLAQSAEFRAAQVEALGRPTLSATAGASTAQNDYPKIGSSDIAARQAALNGRYPLFNRANSAAIDQARRQLDSATADLDSAEQDLIVRAAQTYFDVLAAQDTLGTTRANKAAITETLASAKRNFEVGTATITDTREALGEQVVVGGTGIVPQPLLVPVLLPATVPGNAEEWVSVADTQHPAILRARVSFEGRRAAHARCGGRARRVVFAWQHHRPVRHHSKRQPRRADELAALHRRRNAEPHQGNPGAGRQEPLRPRRGTPGRGARHARGLFRCAVGRGASEGYKVGVRVNLDVLNAQSQLFQTQRDLAKARYDVLVGGLKLRQASGRLTPQDLAATNRLLKP
jgi:outer membrane protein